jgi:putative membrane protein
MTPDSDLIHQCNLRAELEFWKAGIQKTQGSTGILLFISVVERRAVVLADEAIAKILPPETWQTVIERLLEGARRKDLAEGFSKAIELCGELLAKNFPRASDDKDELANQLIIKE